jgi:hypothetical protein
MHILRPFTLLVMLAALGCSFLSQGARAGGLLGQTFGDSYDGPVVNPYGGGELLPPAAYVIDAPLRGFDNGYNPTYYWNRPPYGSRPSFPGPAAYAPPPCNCRPPFHHAGFHGEHHHHHPGHRAPVKMPDDSTPP